MSRWTNQGQLAWNAFGQTLGSPFQNIPYPRDLSRIRWSCSWVFLRDDFMFCTKDFIPKQIEQNGVVMLLKIELGTKVCHLFEHGVLFRIEHERKLVGEFHILIIHENAHHWQNSGHFENWHEAKRLTKNPADRVRFVNCHKGCPKDIPIELDWSFPQGCGKLFHLFQDLVVSLLQLLIVRVTT